MRMRLLLLALTLPAVLQPSRAVAEWKGWRTLGQRLAPLAQARTRACLIKSCRTLHRELLGTPLPLPESSVLPDEVARAKTYGASWTCRDSTRLLIERLAAAGQRLVLDSSGKEAFEWGSEGKVSFHYYGVDDLRRPRLLADATAMSNFSADVQPGGLMRRYLEEAGLELGKPAAARRVLQRMLAARSGDLLILTRPSEIAVYKDALERAASRLRAMRRDAERAGASR